MRHHQSFTLMRSLGETCVDECLQVSPQVLRSMIAAAMVTAQITGNKGIPGASGQIMLAVAAFNVLDVIAQGAQGTAE